ncbi:hypothetical protein C4D60_Mb10t17520 [Musa balbisiana]|uniref:Nudix hydrolase domain-containing protein n=1 Tax=Musa balbisiana TaxID=52838 RepID=A0A4S8IYQ3_MUSBA|nr:hypothetical protein C4D60_Mb10t17520 [Musa balbisiana]
MSSPLLARKGRHQQRYDNQLRLVAGCIPYKVKADDGNRSGDLLGRVEVLMITSPGRLDLVFPKGGWEIDETAGEAACREAMEEAGVKGILNWDSRMDTDLGVWEFRSKSRQNSCTMEGTCKGYMFALEVTEELDCYPEKDNRDRKWSQSQAYLKVAIVKTFQSCLADNQRSHLDKVDYLRDDQGYLLDMQSHLHGNLCHFLDNQLDLAYYPQDCHPGSSKKREGRRER